MAGQPTGPVTSLPQSGSNPPKEPDDVEPVSTVTDKTARRRRTAVRTTTRVDALLGTTRRPSILFIGGALNQTKIAHAVSQHLEKQFDLWFSPYFVDGGMIRLLDKADLLEWTALGGVMKRQSLEYLNDHQLQVDDGGVANQYDMVVTTSDLLVQKTIRDKKMVLLQEGMTDPENLMYHVVRTLRLPRYLASTSTFGLSDAYTYMCVASDGYRNHFIRKGASPEKVVVTGVPHWDDLRAQAIDGNDFPLRNYVLVATSDARETLKIDRRKRFIKRAAALADGRPMVFKLHPNENAVRATREIKSVVPEALVFTTGNANHMIAHASALITQYSTLAYTGLALGKEVHSYFDVGELRRMLPQQNNGTSAAAMAEVVRRVANGTATGGKDSVSDVCSCLDCGASTHRVNTAAG